MSDPAQERMDLLREYHKSRQRPEVYAGKPRSCGDCGVRRNMYHETGCPAIDRAKRS